MIKSCSIFNNCMCAYSCRFSRHRLMCPLNGSVAGSASRQLAGCCCRKCLGMRWVELRFFVSFFLVPTNGARNSKFATRGVFN